MKNEQKILVEEKGSSHQILGKTTKSDEKLKCDGDGTISWSLRIPATYAIVVNVKLEIACSSNKEWACKQKLEDYIKVGEMACYCRKLEEAY
ncbi:hypothetical protein E2542_SST00997 [Spatholobus suberectus]|nr:hypothetical protein E2542_SST00997 [Spatholobus suberectus]